MNTVYIKETMLTVCGKQEIDSGPSLISRPMGVGLYGSLITSPDFLSC